MTLNSYLTCNIRRSLYGCMCHDIGIMILDYMKLVRDLQLGSKRLLDWMAVLTAFAFIYGRVVATGTTYIYYSIMISCGQVVMQNPYM